MIIVGEGPLRNGLVARSLSMRNVVFTGFLSRVSTGDLLVAYAESDLFVIPSEVGEGMPTALLEALAAGLPIVATRVPGITEVADLEFSKLVAPGNAQQLALALLDMIRDVASLRRMGKRASSFARRFDWSTMTASIVDAFESCISQR
jgi:glycosyltransferase involved in cell wall biosynthesis